MEIYIFLCIIFNILFLFLITFNRPRKRIIYYNIRSESNSLSNWINSRQLIQSFDRSISLNPIREMDEIVEGTRLTRVLSRSPCSTTLPLSSPPPRMTRRSSNRVSKLQLTKGQELAHVFQRGY